jgi:hypothetical protein
VLPDASISASRLKTDKHFRPCSTCTANELSSSISATFDFLARLKKSSRQILKYFLKYLLRDSKRSCLVISFDCLFQEIMRRLWRDSDAQGY